MADPRPAYDLVISIEKRKHHISPHDRGGETAAGITRRWWPDWPGWAMLDDGVTWPNAELEEETYRFYVGSRVRHQYGGFWDIISGDDIAVQDVANRLMLFAVVAGEQRAVIALQRCLNMVQQIDMDGAIGPQTLAALNSLGSGTEWLLHQFEREEVDHYIGLVLRDLKQDQAAATQWNNLRGWIKRSRLA
jgi:lysozyme family protein